MKKKSWKILKTWKKLKKSEKKIQKNHLLATLALAFYFDEFSRFF